MQFFPAALQNLADQFARLPGIGGKTAQRLAFHVLSLPMEDAEEFSSYFSAVRLIQSGNYSEKSGFAAAGFADDDIEGTGDDCEV